MAIQIPGMIAATRAAMAAKKAGSLVNQGKAFNKLQKANFGLGVPVAGAGAAGMFDDSLNEMEIINFLQESGKTISDMDRNLIKQMLASGKPPEVVIKTMLEESGRTVSQKDRDLFQESGKTMSDMDRQMMGRTMSDKDMSGRTISDMDRQIMSGKTMSNMDRQMMAGGGTPFPDLNNDGETTYADILKGRGVYAEGGEAIDDDLAGMEMSEEDAMAEIQSIAPQTKMIEQLVMAVMQMVQQGIGEQEIINFLKEQGLDDEDIEDLFTMVMQQMQQGQQDPIANELQEMS